MVTTGLWWEKERGVTGKNADSRGDERDVKPTGAEVAMGEWSFARAASALPLCGLKFLGATDCALALCEYFSRYSHWSMQTGR